MSESFNPYRDWLGFSADERPPNHYALLGLPTTETDPDTIGQVADRLIARIRSVRPGPQVLLWQALLDELRMAKQTLLDPEAKTVYDASLALPSMASTLSPAPLPEHDPVLFTASLSQGGGELAATSLLNPPSRDIPSQVVCQPVLVMPAALPVSPTMAPATVAPARENPVVAARVPAQPAVSRAERSPRSGPSMLSQVLAGVLGIVVLGLTGGVGYLIWQNREQQEQLALAQQRVALPQPAPTASSPSMGGDAVTSTAMNGAGLDSSGGASVVSFAGVPLPAQGGGTQGGSSSARGAGSANPSGVADSPESGAGPQTAQPEMPGDAKQHAAFTAAVRQVREAMAERNPTAAAKALEQAKQTAQTPAEESEVARLDLMLHYVSEFWKTIAQVLNNLGGAEELEVGQTRIAIVEADASHLIIKSQGSLRSWATEAIPTKLLVLLAQSGFSDAAANKAVLGAFLAVDPAGDPQRARQLFEEARQGGVDTEALIAELEFSPGKAGSASATGGGADKAAPPEGAALESARQEVQKLYQQDWSAAVNTAKRRELAERLLKASPPENAAPEFQYALFDQAYELAVAAEKPALVWQAVDKMAEAYAVDAIALKLAALEKMVQSARGTAAAREIAMASFSLAEQALRAKRMEDTKRVLDVAARAAKDSKSVSLMRQATMARQQLEGGGN